MSVDWDWTRVVFDHVKIGVRDAGASIAFYKTVLEPLGIPPLWESDRGVGYEDNGAPGVREQYSSADAGVYYEAFVFDPYRSSFLVIR
jgi:catechol 2,3-dioxygenase-like lactoylglutathione lyase family enzyme